MSRKIICLDHAAATSLDPRVFSAMKPFFLSEYGNPSALYQSGVSAKKAIENARAQVATALFTNPDTIVFTSGGTEANNMALFGLVRYLSFPRRRESSRNNKRSNIDSRSQSGMTASMHIITTTIEHSSVLEPVRQLEKEGCSVTYLPVNANGFVTVEQVKKAIKKNTVLISIGYANNEIGTIQPIVDIGKMILRYRKDHPKQNILFHTDACQAVNYCDIAVDKLHVDLMTINASKIYGPKGVGALFVRRGIELEPIIYGGGQEQSLRSGTENVAGIVGFGKAIELTSKGKEREVERLTKLQTFFFSQLQNQCGAVLNGSQYGDDRLVNNINIHIPNIEAETLILYLDAAGIECSAGSACSTDSFGSSHILRAIGLSKKEAKECVRFTMGRETKKQDIIKTVKEIKRIIKLLNK